MVEAGETERLIAATPQQLWKRMRARTACAMAGQQCVAAVKPAKAGLSNTQVHEWSAHRPEAAPAGSARGLVAWPGGRAAAPLQSQSQTAARLQRARVQHRSQIVDVGTYVRSLQVHHAAHPALPQLYCSEHCWCSLRGVLYSNYWCSLRAVHQTATSLHSPNEYTSAEYVHGLPCSTSGAHCGAGGGGRSSAVQRVITKGSAIGRQAVWNVHMLTPSSWAP